MHVLKATLSTSDFDSGRTQTRTLFLVTGAHGLILGATKAVLSNTDFDSPPMHVVTLFLPVDAQGDSDYRHVQTDSGHARKATLSTNDFYSQHTHAGTLFLLMCAQGDPDSWSTLEDAPGTRDSDSQFSTLAHRDSDSQHALGDSDYWLMHAGTLLLSTPVQGP